MKKVRVVEVASKGFRKQSGLRVEGEMVYGVLTLPPSVYAAWQGKGVDPSKVLQFIAYAVNKELELKSALKTEKVLYRETPSDDEVRLNTWEGSGWGFWDECQLWQGGWATPEEALAGRKYYCETLAHYSGDALPE